VVTKRLEFQDLIKEDGKSFRLNTKVYKDEEIFRVEQEIFFHNSWTFLAHESQVEYPNDYMNDIYRSLSRDLSEGREGETEVFHEQVQA